MILETHLIKTTKKFTFYLVSKYNSHHKSGKYTNMSKFQSLFCLCVCLSLHLFNLKQYYIYSMLLTVEGLHRGQGLTAQQCPH